MERIYNRRVAYFPIKLLMIFLVFSELLFLFGPIAYNIPSKTLVSLFLIIVNISLCGGYKFGIAKYRYHRPVNKTQPKTAFLKVLILAGLVISLYTIFVNWHLPSFSLGALANRFLIGLTDSATVYYERLEQTTLSGQVFFLLLMAPIPFIAKVFGVIYWKQLKTLYQLLVVFLLLLDAIYWIGIGTRKGLADIMVLMACVIVLLRPHWLILRKSRRIANMVLISAILLFVFYFVISNMSRYGLDMNEVLDMVEGHPIKPFYLNHISPYIYLPLREMTSYLCQGYYALSLAIYDFFTEGVFCFAGGMGNNWFFINVTDYLLPELDVLSQTYMQYLSDNYGISPTINWHSLYLWWANDVTFFGVPIVMFVIGRVFALVWMDAYYYANMYAAPSAVLMALMVFYAFAGNQVLSFSFLTFSITFGVYFIRRIIKLHV